MPSYVLYCTIHSCIADIIGNAINRHAASRPNDKEVNNELSISGLGRELGQRPAINLSHGSF